MSDLDEKLAKALAGQPANLHGLIRKSIEQEHLFEMLARAAYDATDGASEWEGGGAPRWEEIKAPKAVQFREYELKARQLGTDFWNMCNLLGIPEKDIRERAEKYIQTSDELP